MSQSTRARPPIDDMLMAKQEEDGVGDTNKKYNISKHGKLGQAETRQ